MSVSFNSLSRPLVRSLVVAGLMLSPVACGPGSDATAQSGAHAAARDGKKSMSDARARLKELRGGRSGDTSQAHTGEALPDWYPKSLWLPEDFELISAQIVGGQTCLVSGKSHQETAQLVADYRRELAAAGYELVSTDRTPADNQVIFSRNGAESGQVNIVQAGDIRQVRLTFSPPAG